MNSTADRTPVRPAKRARPPNLTLGLKSLRFPSARPITIETVQAVVDDDNGNNDDDRDEDNDAAIENEVWSSPSSGTSSPLGGDSHSTGSDSELSDDLSKNLERLEKLRQNVHRNLRLRPLRSATAPPDSPSSAAHATRADAATVALARSHQHRPDSPYSATDDSSAAPSPAYSVYYTPTTEFRESPTSARFIGNHGPSASSSALNTPLSREHARPSPVSFSLSEPPVVGPRLGARQAALAPASVPAAVGVDPDALFARLLGSRRPLLIDTRPTASYLSARLMHSLNIAIPSLIVRRSTKQGGFASINTLRTYITTDRGKSKWDEMTAGNGLWDGNIVIYDEEMDDKNRDNLQILSWAMISLLRPLAGNGSVEFLKGGTKAAFACGSARDYIMTGEDDLPAPSENSDSRSDDSPRKGGLFQLDTLTAARSKPMPEIEAPSTSPGPLLPSSAHNMLCDYTPSPSPSTCVFPQFAKPRKGSIPSLRRLDTTSAERLVPKLTLRTLPVKSNTLAAPMNMSRRSSSSSLRSNSPSHLTLPQSNKRPSSLSPPSTSSSSGSLSPNRASPPSYPHSPTTPIGPISSPATARPDLDQPPTTEDPLPSFTVSCILPNFLFLGPEPSSPEHVEELQSLGVKRILNIAIECDDDQGLKLRQKFERYTRIPMRDIVEEENVSYSVREACEALDDARLHSAPTYVHCKAGKSRSVTAVIAYLIHANHWTLSRAYAFVTERRKGISPNIGFVSELMTFEEQELGGKSIGVVNNSLNGGDADEHGQTKSYAPGPRRAANLRESLPPILATQTSEVIIPGQLSAGGLLGSNVARVGDLGQEVEIKDASGRYRHARRAPVDENTLQPMRRVSKAGLESASYLTASDL